MHPPADGTLKLKRLIKASVARVFEAWTTPSELVQWFGPGDWTLTKAELDLQPSGIYRFLMRSGADGREVEIMGAYREVSPPHRLVFTWRSEGNPLMNFGETLVTIDLVDVDGCTEVRITHQGLPSAEIQERHSLGWESCCEHLEVLLGSAAKSRP